MDLKALHYFITVAEEQNFTHAAERLHMSQPPLSNQVKALEEELGVQLFQRGKRRLRLTEAGAVLLRRARQMEALAERTREEMDSLGRELSGRVRIGSVEGRAPYLAARWITGFREEYPLVTFSIVSGGSDDLIEWLGHGLIDLALVAAPYDEEHLEGIRVGGEPWVAIIPVGHPLAGTKEQTISLRDLQGEPLIVPRRASRIEAIRRWFEGAGIEPQIFCALSNYQSAAALVEQGAGICIFPQTTYTPNPRIVTRVITDPIKVAEYVLVRNREHLPPEPAASFLDYVRDYLEEDRLRGRRVRVGEAEFSLPEGAELL